VRFGPPKGGHNNSRGCNPRNPFTQVSSRPRKGSNTPSTGLCSALSGLMCRFLSVTDPWVAPTATNLHPHAGMECFVETLTPQKRKQGPKPPQDKMGKLLGMLTCRCDRLYVASSSFGEWLRRLVLAGVIGLPIRWIVLCVRSGA